jgi:selenocysteine lyase/cysteine desulfurase
MYAPFGSGALVVRKGLLGCSSTELDGIKASGEENVVGIAAMGRAITLLERVSMDVIAEEEQTLTRRALRGLTGIRGTEIYGVRDPDSPRFSSKSGIVTFSLKAVPHNLVAKELAEQRAIGVRNGCFCAHHIVRDLLGIHPLRTFVGGLGLHVARRFFGTILPGAVRVSFGLENDETDVDALIRALERIASAPRSRVNRLIASTHNGTPFLPRTEAQERIRGYVDACVENVYSFPEPHHQVPSGWTGSARSPVPTPGSRGPDRKHGVV